jgi:hypothetical protein
MIFLLAASLFTACDGRILTDVANSTEKVDKVYRNIIGVVNNSVYYQLNSGIYRNVSGGGSEEQLVANSQNNIVQGSALIGDSTKYIMYITNNPDDLQNGIVHFIGLSEETVTQQQITDFSSDTTPREIIALYNNGSLLVRSKKDDNTNTFTIYYSCSYNGSSFTFKSVSIDLSSSYGVDNLYTPTAEADPTYGILSFANTYDSNGSTDYAYSYYLIDFKTGTATLITGDLTSYQLAGFTIDHADADAAKTLYAITTGGRLYKASTSGSFSYCESLGYSYEPNAAFMYRIYDTDNAKNYLITKRSTKNSALVVYSFTDGAVSFSSTTVRYGYAQKISKDLITSAYEISSDSSTSKLLVATNESGMVDITIYHDSVTSNTTGKGSTSDFEEYIF